MKKLHEIFEFRHIPGRAIRYGSMLAAVACLGHAGVALAEKEWEGKPMIAETMPSFKRDKADKTDQNARPPAESAPSNAYDAKPGNAWWEHAEGDSPLRRFIKLFYGPDRPPGPDRDVDTNISAGGAGGG
jgi:hypothetical protein